MLNRYETREVGGREHVKYWIPAEDLALFNQAIVGEIRVVAKFRDGVRAVSGSEQHGLLRLVSRVWLVGDSQITAVEAHRPSCDLTAASGTIRVRPSSVAGSKPSRA